ncbi:unnamed protein product [Notodromas monacha]|uniref:Uncharacterized protein n=1 Tax=Notodromas monacha TaxID=399045 RepID=A0A7R9GEJ9_9CRUS|nr:unnamed protein product [Notodromas monacha]CAG0917948.1 unnamed protein product [Notodromas monacha]
MEMAGQKIFLAAFSFAVGFLTQTFAVSPPPPASMIILDDVVCELNTTALFVYPSTKKIQDYCMNRTFSVVLRGTPFAPEAIDSMYKLKVIVEDFTVKPAVRRAVVEANSLSGNNIVSRNDSGTRTWIYTVPEATLPTELNCTMALIHVVLEYGTTTSSLDSLTSDQLLHPHVALVSRMNQTSGKSLSWWMENIASQSAAYMSNMTDDNSSEEDNDDDDDEFQRVKREAMPDFPSPPTPGSNDTFNRNSELGELTFNHTRGFENGTLRHSRENFSQNDTSSIRNLLPGGNMSNNGTGGQGHEQRPPGRGDKRPPPGSEKGNESRHFNSSRLERLGNESTSLNNDTERRMNQLRFDKNNNDTFLNSSRANKHWNETWLNNSSSPQHRSSERNESSMMMGNGGKKSGGNSSRMGNESFSQQSGGNKTGKPEQRKPQQKGSQNPVQAGSGAGGRGSQGKRRPLRAVGGGGPPLSLVPAVEGSGGVFPCNETNRNHSHNHTREGLGYFCNSTVENCTLRHHQWCNETSGNCTFKPHHNETRGCDSSTNGNCTKGQGGPSGKPGGGGGVNITNFGPSPVDLRNLHAPKVRVFLRRLMNEMGNTSGSLPGLNVKDGDILIDANTTRLLNGVSTNLRVNESRILNLTGIILPKFACGPLLLVVEIQLLVDGDFTNNVVKYPFFVDCSTFSPGNESNINGMYGNGSRQGIMQEPMMRPGTRCLPIQGEIDQMTSKPAPLYVKSGDGPRGKTTAISFEPEIGSTGFRVLDPNDWENQKLIQHHAAVQSFASVLSNAGIVASFSMQTSRFSEFGIYKNLLSLFCPPSQMKFSQEIRTILDSESNYTSGFAKFFTLSQDRVCPGRLPALDTFMRSVVLGAIQSDGKDEPNPTGSSSSSPSTSPGLRNALQDVAQAFEQIAFGGSNATNCVVASKDLDQLRSIAIRARNGNAPMILSAYFTFITGLTSYVEGGRAKAMTNEDFEALVFLSFGIELGIGGTNDTNTEILSRIASDTKVITAAKNIMHLLWWMRHDWQFIAHGERDGNTTSSRMTKDGNNPFESFGNDTTQNGTSKQNREQQWASDRASEVCYQKAQLLHQLLRSGRTRNFRSKLQWKSDKGNIFGGSYSTLMSDVFWVPLLTCDCSSSRHACAGQGTGCKNGQPGSRTGEDSWKRNQSNGEQPGSGDNQSNSTGVPGVDFQPGSNYPGMDFTF